MLYYKDYDYSDIKNLSFIYNSKNEKICNDIFTFDTEVSSAFFIKGKWRKFYYTLSKEYYEGIPVASWVYIWQFSINETVIYGRTLEEFKDFFDILCNRIGCKFIVYVHNLSYEFQFLRNIFTWERVFARTPRKVMKAEYHNSIFKCSYFLSRMSLDTISKECNVKYTKVTGGLRYDILRFNDTKLTELEMSYCENDCLALYEYILEQRMTNENRIDHIPLTQTGNVRKILRSVYRKNVKYKWKCKNLVPNVQEFLLLKEVFWGGLTRANATWALEKMEDVYSYDISSSYPYVMLTCKYPVSHFVNIISNDNRIISIDREEAFRHLNEVHDDECYIINVTFHCLQSMHSMKYIPSSKVIEGKGILNDNGRVAKADKLTLSVTDIDFNLIDKLYKYDTIDINELYVARVDYLDDAFRQMVVDLFESKNLLKGDKSKKSLYLYRKQLVNSLYGMMVTNLVQPDISFSETWEDVKPLTRDDIEAKLNKQKYDYNTLTIYSNGIYVTAYARKNLVESVLAVNDDFVYCDTDSNKFIGNHADWFEKYNEKVYNTLKSTLNDEQLKAVSYINKGKVEYIGQYSYEGKYDYFKTLGAKKYCTQVDDVIETTVSGLSKSAGKYLQCIDEFDLKKVFSYKQSGRNIAIYIEDNPSYVICGHEINYKYGIVMQPTTYTLGISKDYDNYLIECDMEHIDMPYLNSRKEFKEYEKTLQSG